MIRRDCWLLLREEKTGKQKRNFTTKSVQLVSALLLGLLMLLNAWQHSVIYMLYKDCLSHQFCVRGFIL